MKKIVLFFVVTLFLLSTVKSQFYIPPQPKKIYPVQDYTGILSIEEKNKLNKKLIFFFKKTSIEILVAIINNTHGVNPNFIAYKWGEKWKIGKLNANNGVVILLSINDKKISIQNGYGIEPYLTDIISKKIINNIKPDLKKHLYYKAIDNCTSDIYKILNGKFNNKKNIKNNSWIQYIILMFFIIILIYINKNFKNLSFLETLILTNFLFHKKDDYNEDDFDGFEGGGDFGGGGSNDNW